MNRSFILSFILDFDEIFCDDDDDPEDTDEFEDDTFAGTGDILLFGVDNGCATDADAFILRDTSFEAGTAFVSAVLLLVLDICDRGLLS
jgi:hypothetical protein